MDSAYDRKLREMQQYLPFLEEKIEQIKKIKLKSTYPDPAREDKLTKLQNVYKILRNKDPLKNVQLSTLEKFEQVIKKLKGQDFLEARRIRPENTRDPNPMYNPDHHRPSSSCSNASGGSGSSYSHQRKVFDETPASPSPPRSPLHNALANTAPIVIPTEVRSRFVDIRSPPRPASASSSSTTSSTNYRPRYLHSNSPPPDMPRIVPIDRVDVRDMSPQEWDSDPEDEKKDKRQQIIVPKADVFSAVKRASERFLKKEDTKPVKREYDAPHHSSSGHDAPPRGFNPQPPQNPHIQKPLLTTELTNFLKTIQQTKLSPNISDEGLHSPDQHILRQSPAPTIPLLIPRRDVGPTKPATPSLLLSAPPKTSELPIEFDDLKEYLNEDERRNLKRGDLGKHMQPRLPVIKLPGQSPPISASPRSDGRTPSLADPRQNWPMYSDTSFRTNMFKNIEYSNLLPPSDPRTRPSGDPRLAANSNDPRLLAHGTIPSSSVPRYADNYERHKRTQPLPEPLTPTQSHHFGQESMPNMIPPPVQTHLQHGAPPLGSYQHNQICGQNQINYAYPNNMQSQQQQSQWQPTHSHMQPNQQIQMSQGFGSNQGWQNSNMFGGPATISSDMQGHHMMNGDSRMAGPFSNQMNRPPHMPHMNNYNQMGSGAKYSNYQDSRQSYDHSAPHYDQQNQQHPPNDYQRMRQWGRPQDRNFGNQSNTPFSRPNTNPHNRNKDGPRPLINRDPRMDRSTNDNRDPRMQRNVQEQNNTVIQSIHPNKETPKPIPGKEVHPNKLSKNIAVEKESAVKKRPEVHKLDPIKNKDKDKEKEKNKDKNKDKDKLKPKNKLKSKTGDMKSPLTNLYGTIDAKKAMQGQGLNKFKIPKKRHSSDTRAEPTPPPEEETGDSDEEVPSTSHESLNKTQSESTSNKESVKSNEKKKNKEKVKIDEKKKKKEKSKSDDEDEDEDEDEDKNINIGDFEKILKKQTIDEKSAKLLYTLLKRVSKETKRKEKKKKKTGRIESSSDEEDDKKKKKKKKKKILESDEDDSSDDAELIIKKLSKKKKIIESSDESDDNSKKDNKKKDRRASADGSVAEEEKKKKRPVFKRLAVDLGVKKSLIPKKVITEEEAEKTQEICPEKESVSEESIAETEAGAAKNNLPKVKAKRNRELDALQEDLRTSWICDAAMRATGSRACSQKNKTLEQEPPVEDESGSTRAAASKKKTRAKPGPKSKKIVIDSNDSSESENEDTPSKSKTSPKNKKSLAKNISKNPPPPPPPPPMFDESSNESFNLDASAVEPTTDIALHPESSDKAGAKKKASKKGDGESSSDESYISNASSSLLLDTSNKQLDYNQAVLEEVMSNLSAKPKYTATKKKQIKKKKSSWQMGILSKKKKKKTQANKGDDSESVDSNLNEQDLDTSSDKNISRAQSIDQLNDCDSTLKSKENDEEITKLVDSEALIGYTLSSNDKHQCLLCPFYRKNIVHHYKTMHPGKEVLISRLSVTDAELAVEGSKKLDLDNTTEQPSSRERGNYSCRFCSFTAKGIDSCARESFYEHCTNHTGEYRFSCLHCKYEAIAKGSIRSHYYKECRKNSNAKNLAEAVMEDPIPEGRIFGYLCTKCNFVQLKKSNVERHVRLWHSKEGKEEIKIVKIDMSLNVKKEMEVKSEPMEIDIHNIELKKESVKEEEITNSIVIDQPPKQEKQDEEEAAVPEADTSIGSKESDISITLETNELKPEKIEEKPEKRNNLSAFVCAAEMEENELEIQNERKKKMKEIAQNIGIKVDKDETQKRFSIIDRLSAKIDLPLEDNETLVPEKMDDSFVSQQNIEDPLQISEHLPESEKFVEEETPAIPETTQVKKDPEIEINIEKEDKTSAKIKDPLEFVSGPTTVRDSDEETSDVEPTVPPVQFESDSSGEQSDQEISPDVSSILQNTNEVGSPSKGRMLTTIQRLAASLKNKPLDTPQLPEPEPETIIADAPEPPLLNIKKEKISPKNSIENLNMLSPSKVKKEVKHELISPTQNEAEQKLSGSQLKQSASPKQFIRIRRISGDKLSKGTEGEITNNENNEPSMTNVESLRTQDDSGFLKIENVISLAQNESESPNQIANNLQKVVQSSPTKRLSLLKKPNFIIKRIDNTNSLITPSGETVKIIPLNLPQTPRIGTKSENFVPGQQTVSITVDSKGQPISMTTVAGTSTTNLMTTNNLKIVKIQNPEQLPAAIKLKSANVYENMLMDDKLIHSFKCMGKDCSFSSNSEQQFNRHIRLHESDRGAQGPNGTKDYLKCAYCYSDCSSYDDLLNHLKVKHIFCRYCCKYCFYRGFAYSYVELHQKQYHSKKPLKILIVAEELVQLPPHPQRMDRKTIIKPFVCVHECNKYFFIPEAFVLHLKMSHSNLTNFKCHVCAGQVQTSDALIEHYRSHGFYKYHCMYCSTGSPTIKDLHLHLSIEHFNQPPQILERTLPREISKSISAIDQLKVRDVDITFRQSSRIKSEENENVTVAIPSLKSSGQTITISPNKPIVTGKLISTKDGQTFVPISSLPVDSSSVSNIRIVEARSLTSNIVDPRNLTPVTPASLMNLGKNIKVTVTETPLKQISTNEQQVTQSANNDEASEFISTNFFDHTPNALLTASKAVSELISTPRANYADDDSDIEIIEDYTTIKSNDTLKAKSTTVEPKVKEETPDDTPESTFEAADPVEGTTLESTDPATSIERFLTLEDVKDTGLAGRELYVCGVESCRNRTDSADELRVHMQQCSPQVDESTDSSLYCVHCGPSSKRFSKPSFFIDHLKTHGVKRFACALCNGRFAVQSQAQSHLRAKHKITGSKIVPADPMNPSTDGLFVVHPTSSAEKIKNKKQSKAQEKELVKQEIEKTTYGPSEIDLLPKQQIYQRAVQCACCPFNTKVRINMLRHLQCHLSGEFVPDSSPINPVPCLDKKEKMFDKMVNLASSSHEQGRMSGGAGPSKEVVKTEEEEALPKFVPENKRYVCGVPECNYLTVEEAMLRCHLKALHSDEVYFRCPHCPAPQDPSQNIAFEKMGVHLKMHDCRLYKCSHCIYHHYHRHVVERHLADKHPENRPFVKVIRELQGDQTNDASQSSTVPSATSLEPEEQDIPDPDGNTWKCNLCDFKGFLKTAVQQHCATVHDEKCQFKCNGCSFKTISRVTFDQHMLTKHANDPHVDYTTIYQRIKTTKKPEGIEPAPPQDEPFDTTPLWRRDMNRVRHIRGILIEEEEENKSNKRKSETQPAKVKSNKSVEESLKSPDAKKARVSIEDIDRQRQLDGNYGPYGKPTGDMYTCTICCQFKSKYKHDFRDHLYRDLKYQRWHCQGCEYKCVNRGGLVKHISTRHQNENLEPMPSEPNESIEEWVQTVIKTQLEIMQKSKIAPAAAAVAAVPAAPTAPTAPTVPTVPTAPTVEEENGEESEDEPEDPLKEEDAEFSDEEKPVPSSELLPQPIICKHCKSSFSKWRGFKRHVQLKHLKRLAFLCSYCDRSTNSESVMLKHVRSKHSHMPERILDNPNKQSGDLSPEFWEREYGLIIPKKTRKRKRMEESKVELEFNCDKCDFSSTSNAGLKNHMKTHEQKVKQKCSYCTFVTFNNVEMRQHWEVNHSPIEFKVEEALVTPSVSESSGSRTTRKFKLEEEKKTTIYYCFYCDMSSTELDSIRSHWKALHKEDMKSSMFKYREQSEVKVKCAYCAESGTKNILVSHILNEHGLDKPILIVERAEDGWMCVWCREKEFFLTKEDLDDHHKWYHSHLQPNYKVVSRHFKCKHCNFDTISLEAMQKHSKSHLSFYRCKYCSEKFNSFNLVKNHFINSHPTMNPETRKISNDDFSKEMEKILEESSVFIDVQLQPIHVVTPSTIKSPPTSPRMAKKSTTKQSVVSMRPFPAKIKAVARKSTTQLPRRPSGTTFDQERERPSYPSFYGKPAEPVDLSKLSTTMAVAGMKMKVQCSKLAELFNININPTLKIEDSTKKEKK